MLIVTAFSSKQTDEWRLVYMG